MSDRHTDAAFPPISPDMAEFLAGIKVPVRSEVIGWARFDESAGRLVCFFPAGGVSYAYPCNQATAIEFARAPSKMGFIWDRYLYRGEKGTKL